jgi:hypothetical protein
LFLGSNNRQDTIFKAVIVKNIRITAGDNGVKTVVSMRKNINKTTLGCGLNSKYFMLWAGLAYQSKRR